MNEPKPNIKYAKALVHVWSLDQTPAGPGFACALAKKSLEWQQDRIATLESALRDLLEQIDCLDDIAFSKDTEPYKAEACWDDANRRARDVLKGAKP